MDISDPTSPNFGKHWTSQQIHEIFSPTPEAVASVREWLNSSGIPNHRHEIAPSSIRFDASLDEVKSLLKADYHVWEHIETGSSSVSCDEYHVPQNIKRHIDFVTPTVALTQRSSRKQKKRDGRSGPVLKIAPAAAASNENLTDCSEYVTPACIRALYGVPPPITAVDGNEMGIFESGDTYDQPSLNLFFQHYATNIPNDTHPILQGIDGGTAPVSQDGGGESALDFDIAYPLLYSQQIKLYQTFSRDIVGQKNGFFPFDAFLDALDGSYWTYEGGDNPQYDPKLNHTDCGIYNATNVISISYHFAEAHFPAAYNTRQCHEYMKLGLMGTSLIFSSGDNGTLAISGKYGCLADGAQNPNFASSCPYGKLSPSQAFTAHRFYLAGVDKVIVTSVGATQISPGAAVTAPEVAVNPEINMCAATDPGYPYRFSSGGGFSNDFARPAYQDAAVSSFLNSNTTKLPANVTYNRTGRAFPDVSANGYNIVTYTDAEETLAFGTSASAPIFASIINRLNEERILAGKGPIGFLNPILYSHPEMFNDIVEGYNLGCNGAPAFNATSGWDPVTGLGTPNYPKMQEVFLGLP